jgi:glycosyltransferase involved in cell wall biosynthesis
MKGKARQTASKRSVLIIHRYFWPENISETPLVLRALAELHTARGDKVRVATGASEDFTARWAEAFGDSVSVRAFRAPVDRGLRPLRRLPSSLRLLWLGASELVHEPADQVYVLSYPPLVGGLIIAFVRATRRASWTIYIVQDLFTYRLGNALLRKAYIAFSGFALSAADRTVTLSEAMKRQLLTHVRPRQRASLNERTAVIPNFSNELDQPMPHVPASKAYDIIYAGAHGKPQNLELFVSAMSLLPPKGRPRSVFYGSGAVRALLIAQAQKLGLGPAIEFRAPVPREDIAAEIAKARFGLVGALPDLMNYAFPSKLANYAALGVPSLVMCADDSETSEWLRETGLGLPLDPAQPDRAARQLEEYFAADAPRFDPQVVREAACRQFGKQTYLTAVERLVGDLERSAVP